MAKVKFLDKLPKWRPVITASAPGILTSIIFISKLIVKIPAGCPTPTCNVDYEITDAWGKHGAHNTGQNNRNNQPLKFGYVFKIKVPAEYWTRKGFSVMLRWRNIQSASFQLWNANFFNIYRKNGGIDVLIHSRPYDANWDRVDAHEFVFVADRLAINSLRKFFW